GKAIAGARAKWGVPDNEDPLSGLSGSGASIRPEILTLAQLEALPPPKWLIEGLIPAGGFVVTYGPPKAYKTFIALSQGLHIADGQAWFGRPVAQRAVVYMAGEGVGGLAARIKAIRARHGISIDCPFFVIPRAVNLRNA